MKKTLTLLLAVLMMFVLAACSGGNTTSAPAPSDKKEDTSKQAKTDGPKEIEFWYSLGGKSGDLIQSMVDDFNASQNDVKVKATFQGDYYTNHAKVMSAIAAGTQPDVTMVEIASIGAFGDAGALADLQPFVDGKNGVKMDDFIPGLLGNSYWNNKFYALPFNRSTPIMYVNKDMLKENGLDPAGPKTWDELKTYAKKLSIKDQRWGFSTPIDIWFYEALVFENGGRILSEDGKSPMFNQKEGVEPVDFWASLIKDGSMKMPPGEKYNAWDVAAQDFTNGKVGMIFSSTGSLNGLMEQAQGFEVGTAFLPAKKDFGVPTGGTNLVMLEKSKNKDATWAFMKWMTEKEQTIRFSQGTGYMPVRQSAVESDAMKKLYEEKPQFKVAIDQLEYAKPRPMVPGYKELQVVIMDELQRAIIDDKVSAQEALDNAATKAEKLLK